MYSISPLCNQIRPGLPLRLRGRIIGTKGPLALARLPYAAIGDVCMISTSSGTPLTAVVKTFHEDLIYLAPVNGLDGLNCGATVTSSLQRLEFSLPEDCLGGVFDVLGNRLEQKDSSHTRINISLPLESPAPHPLRRTPIARALDTGIKAIDALAPLGYGQRIGLLASAGTGKSTLLGMLAQRAAVDVIVVALVGERGREVREFIDTALGAEAFKRALVVVATSDESPIRRALAPMAATAVAEHFRAQGKHVLLLVDSLTRTARAMRDVGLAAGEMPVRLGYPSSVYTDLPRLIERGGTDEHGSITAVYTVLLEDEHESDPLGNELKSLLDGHLILDQRVAQQGILPAIDSVASLSRLTTSLRDNETREDMLLLKRLLARINRDRDLLLLGGQPDPELATAIALEPALRMFLNQDRSQHVAAAETLRQMRALAKDARTKMCAPSA